MKTRLNKNSLCLFEALKELILITSDYRNIASPCFRIRMINLWEFKPGIEREGISWKEESVTYTTNRLLFEKRRM